MITLITPTRNRSKAFGFLEDYISRQTYKGEIQWVVVNDGDEPYKYRLNQEVVIRSRADDNPATHSICYNYRAALPLVRGDKVLCIEDDDFYSPEYIQVMSDALNEHSLVGLAPALYYHVTARKWRNMKNQDHASLASTGFSRDVLPVFEQATKVPNMVYLDLWLWAHWRDTLQKPARLLANPEKKPLQVGLKGLPWGVGGIGLGHDPQVGQRDTANYTKLKAWLGQDWERYRWPK